MKEVNIKELRNLDSGQIRASLPFWLVSNYERIAIVIPTLRNTTFYPECDLVDPAHIGYGDGSE